MTENMKATFEWLKQEGYMVPALKIDREDLVMALMSERYYLVNNEIDECDVRLVVYVHDASGTIWELKTGDVSYDTVHGVYCGASMIGQYDTNDGIRETADDLISQVEDQHAEDFATPVQPDTNETESNEGSL